MRTKSLTIIAGVAIVTLLYLVYLAATFEAPQGTTTIVIPTPALPPAPIDIKQSVPSPQPPVVEVVSGPDSATAQVPVVEPEPTEVVVESVVTAAPDVIELPSLNNSDSFVFGHLRQLRSGVGLLAILTDQQIIRRFVVLVDNISKGNLPQTNLPYRTIGSEMPVRNIDENLYVMDESAFQRFNAVVDTVVAIDVAQAMTLYRLVSPLFQQAYSEIGFRDVNFDDTLRRAIRNVLNASELAGPFQLVKPSVMYLYADANIENMQDVQKQIIRLGPENAEKLKTRLRQFLQQL